MNRLQLWKVVSVALLACGLASAQNITTFSAPGAGTGYGQGTGGFGINPQGTVVGSFLDDGNVFHGFQCVSGWFAQHLHRIQCSGRGHSREPGHDHFQHQPVRSDGRLLH